MWREWFGPKARIIGIDANPQALELMNFGFEIRIGDQSSREFWHDFFLDIGSVDVIIDDGGHWNEQQIKTVAFCLDHLRDGGCLIVEDTQTSYYSWMGNPHQFSFINFSKYLVDMIHLRNTELRCAVPEDCQYVANIYKISYYNSLLCIYVDRRRCELSVPVDNRKEFLGYSNVGTETSSYGLLVKRLKGNKLFSIVLKIPFSFAYLTRKINFLLLFFRHNKLKEFFKM